MNTFSAKPVYAQYMGVYGVIVNEGIGLEKRWNGILIPRDTIKRAAMRYLKGQIDCPYEYMDGWMEFKRQRGELSNG